VVKFFFVGVVFFVLLGFVFGGGVGELAGGGAVCFFFGVFCWEFLVSGFGNALPSPIRSSRRSAPCFVHFAMPAMPDREAHFLYF